MTKLLLDTGIIFDFLKGNKKAMKFLEKNAKKAMCISSITAAELFVGVRNEDEMKALSDFINTFETFEITKDIASDAGLLRKYYCKNHTTTLASTIIAATAIFHNCTLITLNQQHYPMMKNLKSPY